MAWLPRRRAGGSEGEKARQRREMDTRGQTGSENIKAKRKLPDKQTGVYLNECSFRPVVCRNHCYPLIAGCPVVSFHLLPGSSPLFIPPPPSFSWLFLFLFASFSPHLTVVSLSFLFGRFKMTLVLLIHWRHPWVNRISDLTATRTLTHKQTHVHTWFRCTWTLHTKSQKEQIRWMTSDISGKKKPGSHEYQKPGGEDTVSLPPSTVLLTFIFSFLTPVRPMCDLKCAVLPNMCSCVLMYAYVSCHTVMTINLWTLMKL